MSRDNEFSKHVSQFAAFHDLEGANVLELGADRWRKGCNVLLENGARHIETTNIVEGWPELEKFSDQITVRKVNANKLTDYYEDNTFDAIFGMAILEHIPDFNLMLEEIDRVLRPNGMAYLHGGPIWTSSYGHHIYLKVEDQTYTFSDSPRLIGPWEHLYRSPKEISAKLSDSMPAHHAEKVADFIWNSSDQNRWGFNKIKEIFEKSPLKIVGMFFNAFVSPSEEILQKIVSNGGAADERYDVSGVTFLVKKGS